MSDEELRELERRFQETGAPEDEGALLRARVRAGLLSEDLLRQAAGSMNHWGAQVALGQEHDDWGGLNPVPGDPCTSCWTGQLQDADPGFDPGPIYDPNGDHDTAMFRFSCRCDRCGFTVEGRGYRHYPLYGGTTTFSRAGYRLSQSEKLRYERLADELPGRRRAESQDRQDAARSEAPGAAPGAPPAPPAPAPAGGLRGLLRRLLGGGA